MINQRNPSVNKRVICLRFPVSSGGILMTAVLTTLCLFFLLILDFLLFKAKPVNETNLIQSRVHRTQPLGNLIDAFLFLFFKGTHTLWNVHSRRCAEKKTRPTHVLPERDVDIWMSNCIGTVSIQDLDKLKSFKSCYYYYYF